MKYWDSSGLVPLLVRQVRTADMTRILEEDAEIITWWGTAVECVSAVMRLTREGRLTVPAAAAAERRLQALRSGWNEVAPGDVCRRMAERMLRVHALRAADALQLAAAVVAADQDPTGLDVVCLDGRLGNAYQKEGFSILPQAEPGP